MWYSRERNKKKESRGNTFRWWREKKRNRERLPLDYIYSERVNLGTKRRRTLRERERRSKGDQKKKER